MTDQRLHRGLPGVGKHWRVDTTHVLYLAYSLVGDEIGEMLPDENDELRGKNDRRYYTIE